MLKPETAETVPYHLEGKKYVPKGGPSGGNGGKGGDVIIKVDNNLHTLLDLRYKKKYNAEDGNNGENSLKMGKAVLI